jgi:hypothetical protein
MAAGNGAGEDAEEEGAEEIFMDSLVPAGNKLPGSIESPTAATTALAVPGERPTNKAYTPAPTPLKPVPPSRVVRALHPYQAASGSPEPLQPAEAAAPGKLSESSFAEVSFMKSYHPQGQEGNEDESNVSFIEMDDQKEDNQVTLSNLVEYLAVERGLKRSCATIPLTLALWIMFVLLVFNHGQARSSWETARFIETSMRGISTPHGRGRQKLSFDTITEYGHIMPWLRGALVPMLYDDTASEYGSLRDTQTLVGFVKLMQTRGQNTSLCEHLSDELRTFYDGQCHPPGPANAFGRHETDYSFRPQNENQFVAWLEVGRSMPTVIERIDALMTFDWLDLNTQDVKIEFVFLNAEVHVYTHVELSFVVHREGWLERGVKAQPLRGDVYTNWFQILLDAGWCAVLLVLVYEAVKRLCRECQHGLFWLHIRDPYTWVDWVGIIVGTAIGLFFWFLIRELDQFTDRVANLGTMPQWAVSEAPDYRKVQATLDNKKYQDELVELFDHFSFLSTLTMYHRLTCFWYGLVIVFRFFRGFTGQPRMGVLMQTLLTASDFLFHFLVIFLVIMMSFALGGYVLFGEQLDGWSTAGKSISSLLLFLFGHFNFEDFYSIAPITSMCWFWAFYISAVLVLMNVISAAMIFRYLDVRARLGETGDGIATQLFRAFKDMWWDHTYEGAQKSVPGEELLRMLTVDADPAQIERLGRSMVDRRLRDRTDLVQAINDPVMDVNLLVGRGCEAASAARLLEKVGRWKSAITTRSSPQHRLMVHMGRQMTTMEQHSRQLHSRLHERVEDAKRVADRIELKHAKCISMAKRVQRAQKVPDGWTAHHDAEGRRYLQHTETGLTSWNLPRNMI